MDEVASPNVVKQSTPTACGAACGEMLLKDRGVLTSQIDLGTELTSMNSLARKLNAVDPGWVGVQSMYLASMHSIKLVLGVQ